MLLFVGLGNPTPDSENNRHNVGFKIIDAINKKFSLSKQKPKCICIYKSTKKFNGARKLSFENYKT